MLRVLGCFGLGILFLIISPQLRESLLNLLSSALKQLELYQPWSYCGVAAGALVLVMTYLYRTAQPR
jgi:hypothetical protein